LSHSARSIDNPHQDIEKPTRREERERSGASHTSDDREKHHDVRGVANEEFHFSLSWKHSRFRFQKTYGGNENESIFLFNAARKRLFNFRKRLKTRVHMRPKLFERGYIWRLAS
jgi:hypothetical protein